MDINKDKMNPNKRCLWKTKRIVGSKGEPIKIKAGGGVQGGGRSASPRNAYQERST